MRMDSFDGHDPVERPVESLVDHPHAAPGNLFLDDVFSRKNLLWHGQSVKAENAMRAYNESGGSDKAVEDVQFDLKDFWQSDKMLQKSISIEQIVLIQRGGRYDSIQKSA